MMGGRKGRNERRAGRKGRREGEMVGGWDRWEEGGLQ